MAITVRKGNADKFDKNKLVPGELAIVLDTGELYFCYSAGNTKKLQTEEDIVELLNSSPTAYTALQQCITDLNNNPSQLTSILSNISTLQTEVINARGTYANVDARLDYDETQIAQKLTTGNDYRPNGLINPDFKVWQRGTTFLNANNIYVADRWKATCGTDTYVKIFKSGNILRFEEYGSVGSASAVTDITQPIENYSDYAGKTVTLSVNVTLDTGVSGNLVIYDGVANPTLGIFTTSGTKTFTYTVPSNATYLSIAIRFYRDGLAVGKGMNVNWAKLEINDHATLFIPRSYAEELALCQRYYYRINAENSYTVFGSGKGYQSNMAQILIPFPVSMRLSVPTLTYSSLSYFAYETGASFANNITSLAMASTVTSRNCAMIQINGNITVGAYYILISNATTSAWIAFDAEL